MTALRNGVAGAAVVLGSFAVGVIVVKSPTLGVLLIGALGGMAILLANPLWLVSITLFTAFMSLPAGLSVGTSIGPLFIYIYQALALLAVVFLVLHVRPRISEFLLPGIFMATVAYAAVAGNAGNFNPAVVTREAMLMTEMVIGFILALLIVRASLVKQSMRVLAVVLWLSAAMIVVSSLTGLELRGRTDSLHDATGSAQAVRMITATQVPAMAVLAATLAAQILGRGRWSTYVGLGAPALIITLLSYSRYSLIMVGTAVLVAFVAGLSWFVVRRSVVLAIAAAAVVAAVPAALFLLQNSAMGLWLTDQASAFTERVFGGVSLEALSADQSTRDRLIENTFLERAIAEAPVFGHGTGYAYRPPFGETGTFTASLGTTYAHNFYLWWLVKSGAVGMLAFALLTLTPLVRGIRSISREARIGSAVGVGLLAACVVAPIPLEPSASLAFGMVFGATMGFARPLRRTEAVVPQDSLGDNGSAVDAATRGTAPRSPTGGEPDRLPALVSNARL